MKLNLGCGKKTREGWVNLDAVALSGVDVIHDLNVFPYPFEADTFEAMYADNVLEHLRDLVATLNEWHRIARAGAEVEIIVPYFSHPSAFQDPTHLHFFTLQTIRYFTPDFDYNFYTSRHFRLKSQKLIFSKRLKWAEWFFNRFPRAYETLGLPYLLPASGLHIHLEVIK